MQYAIKGALMLIRHEHAIISQLSIGLLFTGLGAYLGISKTEWMFQCLAIGLVITTEGLNTAIEKICDFIHPDYHVQIGVIKDVAAGAVTFAAITAFVLACFIYVPYLFE